MTGVNPGYVLVPEKITEAQADMIGMPSIVYEKAVARMALRSGDVDQYRPKNNPLPVESPTRQTKPKIRALFRKKPGIKGTFS